MGKQKLPIEGPEYPNNEDMYGILALKASAEKHALEMYGALHNFPQPGLPRADDWPEKVATWWNETARRTLEKVRRCDGLG